MKKSILLFILSFATFVNAQTQNVCNHEETSDMYRKVIKFKNLSQESMIKLKEDYIKEKEINSTLTETYKNNLNTKLKQLHELDDYLRSFYDYHLQVCGKNSENEYLHLSGYHLTVIEQFMSDFDRISQKNK